MADILLVTDSDSLTRVVTRLFAHQGVSVHPVPTLAAGADALAQPATRFRLVVLDAMLTRDERACELDCVQAPGLPLVVLASKADLSRLRAVFAAARTDFLEKPFRPSQLLGLARCRALSGVTSV